MRSEAIIRELIDEIRADRRASTLRDERVTAALKGLQVALAELSKDFRAFRDHVLENQDETGRRIRAVSDFTGMTDPEPNGGE